MTALQGEVPSPANPPSGCYFHPRCPYAVEICKTTPPPLEEILPGRLVSCHRAQELALAGIGPAPEPRRAAGQSSARPRPT
jgi:peptide/nickel transport system ATP-binding protein